MPPVILITGTSTGIGRATVEHLRGKHCHVIATARRLKDIAGLAGENVSISQLDVTDEASRRRAVQEALATHGRIDALVNNAGFGAYLPVEETDLDLLQRMYDVNVFGLHRLTQLVLPQMRRRGSGRIVNVSSIAGHLSFPMLGPYASTKFAVRALTTALDSEVRRFGVRAVLVEPGRIKTEFGGRAHHESGVISDGAYTAQRERFERNAFPARGGKPIVIAKAIEHACLSRRPRFHYLRPLDAKLGNILKRVLPDAWINALTRGYLNR